MNGTSELVRRFGCAGEDLAQGIPVLHVEQVAGVRALKAYEPVHWVAVALWGSRAVTAARARGAADVAARLMAWDETDADFRGAEREFDALMDTSEQAVVTVSQQVMALLNSKRPEIERRYV